VASRRGRELRVVDTDVDSRVKSSIEDQYTVRCEEKNALVVLEDSKEDWAMFNHECYELRGLYTDLRLICSSPAHAHSAVPKIHPPRRGGGSPST